MKAAIVFLCWYAAYLHNRNTDSVSYRDREAGVGLWARRSEFQS